MKKVNKLLLDFVNNCLESESQDCFQLLLDFVNNCLESLWMIHTEVSKDLAVDVDAISVEQAHELRVAQALQAGSSIDTYNPKSAEVALVVTTIAECVSQTFLPGILCNCPHILAGTNVTSGEAENLLASFTRRYVIYRTWHSSKSCLNAVEADGFACKTVVWLIDLVENLFVESRVEQELLQAEHLANVGLVCVVENRELTEVSLLLFGLLGQDVALVSVLSLDLS